MGNYNLYPAATTPLSSTEVVLIFQAGGVKLIGVVEFAKQFAATPEDTVSAGGIYIPTVADHGRTKNFTVSTTVQLPTNATTPIPLGWWMNCRAIGAGVVVTVTGNGFTPNSANGLKTRAAGSMMTVEKEQTPDIWYVTGDTTP